ncbi:MAG: NAD(+)/NADH kinase, partial [Clostridia bacterium]|nr:NAD(+)/NADH kinase [Clostridia bacterium]
SLSAGGPVVNPALDACIITPVCPHSVNSKPMIVPANAQITIRFHADFDDISMLTSDGQHSIKISDGDEIVIKASPLKTLLIKVSDRCFYEIYNKKLHG